MTTEFDQAKDQILPSIDALTSLAHDGVQVIATYPNNDAGGKAIINLLDDLGSKKIPNLQVYRSLGRYLYHGVLALALNHKIKISCVGNSSSGIKETPVFGCPTVNIGSRQLGRLRGQNVLDAEYNKESIISSIKKCFDDKAFRDISFKTDNPYYLGNAGKKVAKVLANVNLNENLIRKRMTLEGKTKDGWFK